ncbi:MAG: hypothetical protein ACFFDN_09985, partial [Candidatus Hodarchaeota archaeon]
MNGFTERQINYAFGFSIIIVFTLMLGILILRKDVRYWANRFFALTFFFFASGIILNLIYLFIYNSFWIAILNYISVSCVTTGTICLLLGILIIYKGEDEIIHNNLTYLFIILMGIIIFLHGLIPEGVRVEFYVPKWSIAFGLYEIIFGQSIFFSIIYFSIKLHRELSPEMQKKLKYFVLGLIFSNISITSIIIKNMDIIAGYQQIDSILNLLSIFSFIFIYF